MSKNLYGSLKLEIKSWEALLTQLVENGMIESDKLSTIRAGLIFIASQAEANAKSITIPLFLKKNTLYLGPLKIANLSYPIELYNREFNSKNKKTKTNRSSPFIKRDNKY